MGVWPKWERKKGATKGAGERKWKLFGPPGWQEWGEREVLWPGRKASFTVPPFSQGEGAVCMQAAPHWRFLLPTAWIGSTQWQDLIGTRCSLAQCLLCSLNPSYSAFLFFEFTIVLLHLVPFSYCCWYLECFSSFPFTQFLRSVWGRKIIQNVCGLP